MKKTKISLLQVTYSLLIGITLFSCNQNTSPKNEGAKQTEKVETKNCYFSGISTDSIFLTINIGKDSVTGTLDYIPFEKDACIGTLYNGFFSGDTLFAMYNSTQEGQTSDSEVAILKKGDGYILSNDIWGGDNYKFNSDYTKGYFIDKSKIKFDGEELKPMDCR